MCSGLDHTQRGFESFARECFSVLRTQSGVHTELVKGSGPPGPGERSVPCLRRDRIPAQILGRALRVRPFRLEAAFFALSLEPLLLHRKPDVVYVSEWDTASALARLRHLTRRRFRLLLCNGSLAAEGFERFDHVQDLTPAAHDYVLQRGADSRRHTVLPLGFNIPPRLEAISEEERVALRARLGLPERRKVVLSVATLDVTIKRLDYLISEVAALPDPRPFLLLAGEPEAETPLLRKMAHRLLGADGFDMRTVPVQEIGDLYRASDVFVLTSVVESQGRALIEAAAYGLPCIAHDSPNMRFSLGEHGMFADMTRRRALTGLMEEVLANDAGARACTADARHRHVYERFSWDCLTPQYVSLLRRVAGAPMSA